MVSFLDSPSQLVSFSDSIAKCGRRLVLFLRDVFKEHELPYVVHNLFQILFLGDRTFASWKFC